MNASRPTAPRRFAARSIYTALSALALLTAACGSLERVEPSVTRAASLAQVRDSAGVQIVEYGQPLRSLPIAFRIVETPTLDLGGPRGDPDQELTEGHPFHHPARLSDGRWVVPDRSSLKVFDADGRFVTAIGRRGDGPGEFRQPRHVCIARGDTIVAIDQYGRVNIFQPDGTRVGGFPVTQGDPESSGCLGDLSILAVSEVRPDPADAAHRVATLRRLNAAGSEIGVVGTFPQGSTNTIIQGVGNTVPARDRLYVGDGLRPEVMIYRLDGTLERIVRWTDPGVPVTDELYEQMARRMFGGNANFNDIFARVSAVPRPATLPLYARIMVDDAGRIWVEDYPDMRNLAGRGPSDPWTVFDPSGQPLGRVFVPAFTRGWIDIRAIGTDDIALHWKDDQLGFVHLTFHALERVSPSP